MLDKSTTMKTFFLLISIYKLSIVFAAEYKCLDAVNSTLPEANMTTDELIIYNGYNAEIHHVITSDGYILELHRIKCNGNESKSCQPVLLQHGFLRSSATWVLNAANQSLGFLLADRGYDVWLGNIRGTSYSHHLNFTKKDARFWDFSWDEMAEYDLPAMVDYVVNATKFERIVYVGHSQGTLIGFAKFSTDLNLAKKIKLFIALAPVSTVGHVTGPLKIAASMTKMLQFVFAVSGHKSFGDVRQLLIKFRSAYKYFTNDHCQMPVYYFESSTISNSTLNQTRIPIYMAHIDDTSVKNFAHYGQMVNSGLMHKYDYGYFKNYLRYGQFYPPEYYPETMDVNTIVFWSPKDTLAGGRDAKQLFEKLKQVKLLRLESFRHVDFLLSLKAATELYPKVINEIENCCNGTTF